MTHNQKVCVCVMLLFVVLEQYVAIVLSLFGVCAGNIINSRCVFCVVLVFVFEQGSVDPKHRRSKTLSVWTAVWNEAEKRIDFSRNNWRCR